MPSWKGKDYVYWCQSYKNWHWFQIEASIPDWRFNIINDHHTVISEANMENEMRPWCWLIPYLMKASSLFKDHPKLKSLKGCKVPEFEWSRLKPKEVPQTKRSGDCGMYAIKYIEHSLAKLPFTTLIDQDMQTFKDKWVVDLFYQHVRP